MSRRAIAFHILFWGLNCLLLGLLLYFGTLGEPGTAPPRMPGSHHPIYASCDAGCRLIWIWW